MIQNESVREKLVQLRKAFYELEEEWAKLDCPTQEEDISHMYPFHLSFDELTNAVSDWVEKHAGEPQ